MKNTLRYLAQRILGFDNYLFLFSIFTIKRIQINKHEQEFLHFINITPDGIVLDVGANIGITTVPLAKRKSQVYSFEPVPQNLKAIKRVISYFKLKNVTVFETALGKEAGSLKMVMPIANNAKMQGLSHVYQEGSTDRLTQGEIFTVPVRKLDDIPEIQAAHRITGIKIDVENYEYPVLKGARELLIKHKPIIYCELWDDERRALTIDYLKNLGYSIKIFDRNRLIDFNNQKVINFFFIPKIN